MKKIDVKNSIRNLSIPVAKELCGFKLISKYRSALMGFSAIWILVFHLWRTFVTMDTAALAYLEYRVKRFGYCGVDIFLLLSGMGLTYAIGKSKLPVFYYRRLKRIILPFITIAVIRMFKENWSMESFLNNISGKAFYTQSIYCFLWFVPAIVSLYIIFPLYWKGFKKTGAYFWTGTMLLLWLLFELGVKDTLRGDLFGFINRIPVFIIGVLLGYLTQTRGNIPFKRRAYFPIALVFILGLKFLELTNFSDFPLIVNTPNCCFPPLLISVSFPFLFAKLLNELESRKGFCVVGKIINGFFKFFAGFTIEIYCLQEWFNSIHSPSLLEKGWGPLKVNIVIFTEIILISFAASVVFKYFWKLVEWPFIRNKKSEIKSSVDNRFTATDEGIILEEPGIKYLESITERMEAAAERMEKATEKLKL